MRIVLVLLVWSAVSLTVPCCGGGGGIDVEQGCRVACCGCDSDLDCDSPRRCWPTSVNGVTYHLCTTSSEICVPTAAKPGAETHVTRLSFVARYESDVLDFSEPTVSLAAATLLRGDLRLTADGHFTCGFPAAEAMGGGAGTALACLGPVATLDDVRDAPAEGYVVRAPAVEGYGYVVRCQEGGYVRLRVREPIVESDGSLVGWMIDWSHLGSTGPWGVQR